MVPKVTVETTIYAKEDKTTFHIKWNFQKIFTHALTMYDTNGNNKFDKNERELIEKSIVSYVDPINYLTNIEYIHKDKEFEDYFLEDFKPHFSEISFDEDIMSYSYKFDVDFVLNKDYKLFLTYYDGGGNFDFIMKDIIIKDYKGFKAIQPQHTKTYVYFYEDYEKHIPKQENNEEKIEENIPDILQTTKEEKIIEPKPIVVDKKDKTIMDFLAKQLNNIKDDLQDTLKDIKENNSIGSYFWLLLFSFIYGVLHALGPGHGKSLVSSYFISEEKSYAKALSISALIGVVHTFSAFFVTLVIYYSLGLIFNSTLINIEQTAIKISAIIIIAIALYLIYKKIPKKEATYIFQKAQQKALLTTQQHNHKESLSCSCSACKTTSTDLGVVVAAGIIPCPGTVTIFIFTISLGIYFVGFLSAIFMSLGMSLIIFITALISVKLRKSSAQNKTITKLFEYGSLVFILLLGVILLIIA